MHYTNQQLQNTLFLDIETVSEYRTFDDLPEVFKPLWSKKAKSVKPSSLDIEADERTAYQDRAGIFSEFAKVVCISIGYLNSSGELRVKSISGHIEKQILLEFSQLLNLHYNDVSIHSLCGHNIKEFDIPFLCRRMLKHGLDLPVLLNISGKKPWQTEHLIDTMDLWRFGDYKNYTSLSLLCAMFDIPTPKDDMDGSMVGTAYWEQDGLRAISTYCKKDVVSVVQILRKFCRLPLINQEMITLVED